MRSTWVSKWIQRTSNVVLLLNKAVWRSGSRNGQDGGNQTSEAHVCWSEGLEKELGVAFVDCFLS